MSRFFVDPACIMDTQAEIHGQDVKHIKNVLRHEIGDEVVLCDGAGTDYECKIAEFLEDKIRLDVIHSENSKSESDIEIVLYQGLPKKDKMELIIQKAIELGVKEIVPVMTERVIVKLSDAKKERKKIDRWNKIAESAAKQSRRGLIPKVTGVLSYKEALKQGSQCDLALIAYEKEKESLKKCLQDHKDCKKIAIYIGPEGGFAEHEVEKALDQGVTSITLGKRILRTETAGFTLTAAIMYEYNQM